MRNIATLQDAKIQKKNKKNRERADVYGCTGIEGAGVYLQRIAALV